MKDIVIIANFVAAVDGVANSRFAYLGNILCIQNQVELITSDFSHSTKTHRSNAAMEFHYKVTLVHEPGYKKNISLKRFVSHLAWGKSVLKYIKKRKRPDIIYCAVPSLSAAKNMIDFCKNNNIRFIIDIQDLWPEAFRMVFHIPVLSSIVFSPLTSYVNRIYSSADAVIAVSKTYVDRALSVNRKSIQGMTVFLGTDLNDFDNSIISNPAELEKAENELWLGYCGSLEASYDLPCVIDALAIIIERGKKPPKLIVMGGGSRRDEFQKYALEKHVDTVFTGRLPYDKLAGMLHECDIAVNPIVSGSAASIINKHSDYACAGLPVINTQDSTEYRNLVDEYSMGFNCENGNALEVADKIIVLIENIELRETMSLNARRCAETLFDRGTTYKKIIDLLENI